MGKIVQNRHIVRIRAARAVLRVDRVRRNERRRRHRDEALPVRQKLRLQQRVVHGAVAVHRNGRQQRLLAGQFAHAVTERQRYAPAVHRHAQHHQFIRAKAPRLLRHADGNVRLLSGQRLRQKLRDLLRAAGRAEIQNGRFSDLHKNSSFVRRIDANRYQINT